MLQLVLTLLGWLTFSTTHMSAWVGELLQYIYATIDSGDWKNDFATHITDLHVREIAYTIGRIIVEGLGL